MKYDFAIIGGGPAGIMSAISAAESGLKVALLEKNDKLGIKFLMTGGGRSNLSNLRDDRELVKGFAHSGSWLFSSLSRFNSQDFVNFLNSKGIETKVENDLRVFPKSDSAKSVLSFFLKYLKELEVDIFFNLEFLDFKKNDKKITGIVLKSGEQIFADKIIVASGGKSYSLTGSDAYVLERVKELGHSILDLKPALVPLKVSSNIKGLEGLSLKDVNISLFDLGNKIEEVRGDCIFTKDSLSGPTILNLSNNLSNSNFKDTQIIIDFLPDIEIDDLDKRMQDDFKGNNKSVKNYLSLFIPSRFSMFLLKNIGVDEDKKVSLLNKEERLKILRSLKSYSFKISKLGDFNNAMISSGGVDLREVDPKTMKSKIIDNLYFAGEVLNLHAISGGYNLQLCWTTGYVAGKS
jgi:predicted Rossmann fold flavoprotein